MGGENVKNTIVEWGLQLVAPHLCFGCGKVGTVLCQDCKNDIIDEPFLGCILCGAPQSFGICFYHNSPISRAFVVGQRGGVLEAVINGLKFNHTKSAAGALADLFDDYLPLLPRDTLLVPIPTVRSHIRQRGYDQVELIVRQFASRRGVPPTRLLNRITNTTQHKVGRRLRQMQAADTFALCDGAAIAGKTVLLFDDIVTTGSTFVAAAQLLQDMGATVWVAALAYQPLEKSLPRSSLD